MMTTKKGDIENFEVKPGKQVAFKTFYNGNLKVFNVPYFPSDDSEGSGFIPYEVLFQLSHIFKYMNIQNLDEFNYEDFKVVHTYLQFHSDKEKAKKKFKDEKDMFIQYALKEWIEKYYEMKLKANRSDSPFGETDKPNDEAVQARQWLDFFHSKLNELPELQREIIKKKYLQIEVSGNYPLDDFVYAELHLTRAFYYRRKKEGLYWLGLALQNHNQIKKTI
ncbi:hypothetical protein D5F11_023095 [Siminovitchia terrae]|uniref:Uncharacterized protein n=1 Tax=Siminovitchia terrae TaxID=1914933 RepID=A0A429X2H3_SIMTE|nr:hypothetical protein [Siminovitchia terrae]RST57398.1 hypothetical protein D5F11_023095 [Siminovitchia terrae]